MVQYNHNCYEVGRLRQKITSAILCDERIQSIRARFEDEDRCHKPKNAGRLCKLKMQEMGSFLVTLEGAQPHQHIDF